MIKKINEMATDKSSAIELCRSLGHRFIEYFLKLTKETSRSSYFKHHCKEMQVWYNDAESIILKYNHKRISNTQLSDWFFTCGESVEDIISDNDINKYEQFIATILYLRSKQNNVDIYSIAKELL